MIKMNLTEGTRLHGFRVRYVQPMPELKGTLYRMEYEKNGADLVWLKRPDDNKTFSIAFKTIPSDSTGVFHILEHSVLCGSVKYPVREPFVELLKSSLQTFLNAMTFPDKTMYPVASRNDQDFLNLIDVYMDAVLHPLSVVSPMGFRQEGWHYELDSPEGELTRNGVVYNEMKGAFVDPSEVLSYELARRLFPDNCYGFESGGHPEHIPELTYESYLANHARYYHPSNSYIFLDGDVDLEAVLEKLDGFLKEYDRIDVNADIPMQEPVCPPEATAEYEVGPEDDVEDKVIVGEGWVYGAFDDQARTVACAVLSQALCGTNESPLKKAVLEAGLCQDLTLTSYDGIQQNFLFMTARNTTLEKKDELVDTVYRVLRRQAEGLDHRELHAILNQVEFANREKDFGRMPRGLVFAIQSLESWLYGGDPALNLSYAETFSRLRRMIDEGGFEKLLREVMLDSRHTARVVLVPSRTLGEEKRARDAAELARIRSGWSDSELERVISDFEALRAFQSAADTPEKLATLPMLALSDIPERSPEPPYTRDTVDGHTVLFQNVETGGITYLDLAFRADDLAVEELSELPLACELLGKLATSKRGALEVTGLIREKLGRFDVSARVYEDSAGAAVPVVFVSAAMLPERKAESLDVIREVILDTSFEDTGAIYNLLRQMRIGCEQAIMGSGNAFAVIRAGAGLTGASAVTDAVSGVGQLRTLQAAERDFEQNGPELARRLSALLKKLFVKARVTVSLTGEPDADYVKNAMSILPQGSVGAAVTYGPIDRPAEGFTIPAAIGFSGRAGKLRAIGREYSGAMSVASKLLTLDYLWNNVRVKGGAYGVNMSVSESGGVSFSSYRDPNCAGSLDVFAGAGQVLRDFVASGESLDKYIISTVGAMEPLMTPRQDAAKAASMYFTGRTPADSQRVRSQVLRTTKADLSAFADDLDALSAKSQICVIAGKPVLDACAPLIEKTESIQ